MLGAWPLRESKLGLLDGQGALVVARDRSGSVVEARGFWRPSDELAHEELATLLPAGATLPFRGPGYQGTSGPLPAAAVEDDVRDAESWSLVKVEVEIVAVERCEPGGPGPSGSLVRLAVRGGAEDG